MKHTNYQLLPLEDYLTCGAGKARRALHKAAFSQRVDHWQYSARAVGLEKAKALVQQQYDASCETLHSAVKVAQLQYDIQLEIVLALEARLEHASSGLLADQLAPKVMSASCQLASYQVTLYQTQKCLRRASMILGNKQEQAEAMYKELLAMDEVVQLRETVRERLALRRARDARVFTRRIGTTQTGKLRQEVLAADLGEHEKDLLAALDLHEKFKRGASYAARRMAEAMRAGRSPYRVEAPNNSHSFAAYGSYVRAHDRQGNTLARWAVAPDGGAYLLKVLQPAGTRRIRRRGQEIKAMGEHGQVLGRYPSTAWLMRAPQPAANPAFAA